MVTAAVNDGFPLIGMIPVAGCTASIKTAGTVINALATASAFAADVAVTVTSTSLAGEVGAVYVVLKEVEFEISPQAMSAHATVHLTPALVMSFTSVAVTPVVLVTITVAVGGVTEIPTDGTSSVAEADFVGSVTEVPVTVTVILLTGGVAGAL